MTTQYIAPSTIQSIAEQIRNDFLPSKGDDTMEVDIYAIAQGLGCKVEEVDFNDATVSAQVLRDKEIDNGYVIQIARNDPPRRKKFSVAHEIAHIVLHDDGKNKFIEQRRPIADYPQDVAYKEIQASMLAAAILLPDQQVRQAWQASKSVDEVAEMFNVSYKAAFNRLDNLNLLDE